MDGNKNAVGWVDVHLVEDSTLRQSRYMLQTAYKTETIEVANDNFFMSG